jgi:hypothetical protein
MNKEYKYKRKTIEVKFPSGMFEYYSDKEGRFLKFDTLKDAKESINKEGKSIDESIKPKTQKIKLSELRQLVKEIIKETAYDNQRQDPPWYGKPGIGAFDEFKMGLNKKDRRAPKRELNRIKSHGGTLEYSKLDNNDKLKYDIEFLDRYPGSYMEYGDYLIKKSQNSDGYLYGKKVKQPGGNSGIRYKTEFNSDTYDTIEDVMRVIDNEI